MVKVVGVDITAASANKFEATKFRSPTISSLVAVGSGSLVDGGSMVSVGVMVAVTVPEMVGVAVGVAGGVASATNGAGV